MSDVHEDIWDIFLHVFDSLHPNKLNYIIFRPLKKYLSGVKNYPYVGKIYDRMLGEPHRAKSQIFCYSPVVYFHFSLPWVCVTTCK